MLLLAVAYPYGSARRCGYGYLLLYYMKIGEVATSWGDFLKACEVGVSECWLGVLVHYTYEINL